MIYNFIYNGINVFVDTFTCQVSFIEPGYSTVKTVWESGNFERDRLNKLLITKFRTWKQDNNNKVIPGTFDTKTVKNKDYSFFNELKTGNNTIGYIADLATLNSLLSSIPTFSDSIACFNPLNWSFFHPIELKLTVGNATNNNGVITAEVLNPFSGATYEYSLDGAAWQPSNVFSRLSPGQYTVSVRSTSELVVKSKEVKVHQLS